MTTVPHQSAGPPWGRAGGRPSGGLGQAGLQAVQLDPEDGGLPDEGLRELPAELVPCDDLDPPGDVDFADDSS